MILEKIRTPGLAHLSYLLVSEGEAAVIDPRRDVAIYLESARTHGSRITHVFETHRNEDLVSGAPALAAITGAVVWHGPDPQEPVAYARTTREGDRHTVGHAVLQVLQTPGHTDDSLSLVLFDPAYDDGAVAVFTGDALFVGEVGRTDFYPQRAREVAGRLFDSLHKLLELGDQVIVHPAHGAGSVCGADTAEREFSTLGHERRNNPRLAIADREAFIDFKVAEHHEQPPYFRLMERLNTEGAAAVDGSIAPPPLSPDAPGALQGRRLVDVRSVHAFSGAHLPGSLAIPLDMLPAFGGWLLSPEEELVLVADGPSEAREARLALARIGYDRVVGALPGPIGMAALGHPVGHLPIVDADTVATCLAQADADWILLDVRGLDEFRAAHIDGARHVYAGRMPGALGRLDARARYTVLCSTGVRATIAASVMRAAGIPCVDVFLGSMKAWQAQGRPVVT